MKYQQVLESSREDSSNSSSTHLRLVTDDLSLSDLSRTRSETVDVIALLLQDKRSENTRRAYYSDLCGFFGCQPTPDIVVAFLSQRPRDIALALARYKGRLMESGIAEATINRRLAAMRSLLKFAHRLEMCETDGRGIIDSERVETYRDTHGISLEQMNALLKLPAKLHGKDSLRCLRDRAILHILFENGLRRGELCKLDVGDFSLPGRRLMILGKGRGTQKTPVTIDKETAKMIGDYIIKAGHSHGDGPLFRNFDHRPDVRGGRLTGQAIYNLVQSYGNALGVTGLRPHKMRHSTGTIIAQSTNGDMTKVQEVLRHKDIRTSARYVKNAANVQGDVTSLLARLGRGKKS